jgi:hypothetical protein
VRTGGWAVIATGSGSCPLVGVVLSSVEPLGLDAEVFILLLRHSRRVSYFRSGIVGYDIL